MKISRDNYEVFFLDFIDGVLDENLMDEFYAFLKQNPDLEAELKAASRAKVEPEKIVFIHKKKLYRQKYDQISAFNRAAIALMEGDLSEKEKIVFENYLAENPDRGKKISLFEKTRLEPDETVIFQKKRKLYRISIGRKILYWSAHAAAAVIFVFFVYRIAEDLSNQNVKQEAHVSVPEENQKNEHSDILNIFSPDTEKITIHVQEEIKAEHSSKVDLSGKNQQQMLTGSAKNEKETEMIQRERTPVEIPKKLSARKALLAVYQSAQELIPMKVEYLQTVNSATDERLLADILREKAEESNLSLNKVAKAGLDLISRISGKKFNYSINTDGEITAVSYDSRLLAVSIPTGSD